MKKFLPRIVLAVLFLMFAGKLAAQTPTISYTSPSTPYVSGTAVTTLNPSSTNVSTYGYSTTSTNFATITAPWAVSTDATGNVYVGKDNGDVIKITPAGVQSNFTLNPTQDRGIVVDGLGNVYVSDFGTNTVKKFSSAGALTATISGFNGPVDLTVDASNNIFLTNYNGGNIIRIPAGITSNTTITAANTYLTGFTKPYGIAIDPSGNLFVSDLNNNIYKIASGTTTVTTYATGFNVPAGLDADASGNIYVADFSNNAVRKVAADGTVSTIISGLNAPTDVQIANSGIMYITNAATSGTNANSVRKVVPTGGYYIDQGVPAGMSFSSSTGAFSGTPTVTSQSITYTVTAWNSGGTSASNTVTFGVGPSASATSICASSGTSTITVGGGSPTGGTYSLWASAVSSPALSTTTTTTLTSPTITTTTVYYVSYKPTGGTESARTPVTVTVSTPSVYFTPTTTGKYLSYPITGGIADVSTAANTPTLQGGPTLTTDRFGNPNSAYTFNGTSQFVSTGSNLVTPGPATFSISIWFKTAANATTGGGLASYTSNQTGTGGATGNFDRLIYMDGSGSLYFGVYNGTYGGNNNRLLSTITHYNDGNWHQVVATLSPTTGGALYVDGSIQSSDATMIIAEAHAGWWRLAHSGNGGVWTNSVGTFFAGTLDEAVIYNTALPATGTTSVNTQYGAWSNGPVCPGTTLTLNANTISGVTYSWTGPLGFTSTSQNPTVTTSAAAQHAGTYVCTITNTTTGCTSSINVPVTVSYSTPVFTATSTVAVNANATITLTSVTGVTYSWDFDGATTATGTGTGPFTRTWTTAGAKLIKCTATNANGCSYTSTQQVIVTIPVATSAYAFSQPITLATGSMGITTGLTNFPALVFIQEPALKSGINCGAPVQVPGGGTSGYDFAFTTSGGTDELFYEVESFDPSTGTLLAWVQLPTVASGTGNTTLNFYFGSATAVHNASFGKATWSSDYQAVYHLSETPGTSSTTADATVYGHTGTTSGMTATDQVAAASAKIGSAAYNFDGSDNKIVVNPVVITSAFTISAWVKPAVVNADQKIITNQDSPGSSSGGYKLGIFNNGIPETEAANGVNRGSGTSPTAFVAGAWHYVQGVFTGTHVYTYVDGVQYQDLTSSTLPSSPTNLYIGVGEGGGPNYYFNGVIDEPRVSNVAKSNDYLKAEYYNQTNYLNFTTSTTDITPVLARARALGDGVVYTWTGNTSTVPTLAANWTSSVTGIPAIAPPLDGTCTLVIPTGRARYPKLLANASIMGLTIESGATFELNTFTLTVGCDIYNSNNTANGIIYSSSNASQITWSGATATQNYVGTNTTFPAQVGTMVVNNTTTGATVNISGGRVDVYSLITLTAGSINVNASGGALTLKSTATQTAAVDQITSPTVNKITGYVNVERFFTGGGLAANRGYRLMSSPVNQTSATVANTNTFGLTYLNNHTYLNVTYPGVFTGGIGGTGSGFSGTSIAPTIYLYKETLPASNANFLSGKHVGISAINTSGTPTSTTTGTTATVTTIHQTDPSIPALAIPIGNGFLMYFAGPSTRSSGSSTIPPLDATFTANGYLNQGTFIVNLWYTPTGGAGKLSNTAAAFPGYNMMGNPYASSINLNTVLTQNTSIDAIYVLGTRTGGTAQNYVTYVNGGTSSPTAQGYAVSGGGFIVHATTAAGTTGTLTFNESQKAPTIQPTGTGLIMSAPKAGSLVVDGKLGASASSSALMALPPLAADQPLTGLYMKMEKDSTVYDYCGIYFKPEYKAKFGDGDALYLNGPTATVSMASLSQDGVQTAVNLLPDYHKGSRIKLKVDAAASGLYYVKIEGIRNIDTLYNIFLIDKLKKDSLDIRHYGSYAFNLVKTDTTTFGTNRFELSITRKPITAVVLASFGGNKVTEGVQLNWKTYNESNYTGFTLEKQNNNGVFEGIYDKQSDGSANYSFIDRAPSSGNNIYRLKQNDIDGKISYSDPLKIFYDKLGGNGLFSVFPNPSVEILNVSIPVVQTTATYKLRLYNASGNLLLQKTSTSGNWSENVGNLKPGAYIVEVIKSDGTSMGKTKFIKR